MKNDDEDSSLRVNGLWKASRGWWKTGASRAVSKITLELQAESGFAVGRAVFPTLLGTHIISMQ